MVERETVIKEQMKYSGLGDLREAYKFAYDWLRDEYFDVEESKYTERIKGNEKELEIIWLATKKITDYFRIAINIKWEIRGMKDVEVEVNGKKQKMNDFGEVKITLKGILEKDYESRWGHRTTFYRFLREVYHKYVITRVTEEKKYETIDYIQEFKEEVKAYFEMTGRRIIEGIRA